jgi:hypothetical protein
MQSASLGLLSDRWCRSWRIGKYRGPDGGCIAFRPSAGLEY